MSGTIPSTPRGWQAVPSGPRLRPPLDTSLSRDPYEHPPFARVTRRPKGHGVRHPPWWCQAPSPGALQPLAAMEGCADCRLERVDYSPGCVPTRPVVRANMGGGHGGVHAITAARLNRPRTCDRGRLPHPGSAPASVHALATHPQTTGRSNPPHRTLTHRPAPRRGPARLTAWLAVDGAWPTGPRLGDGNVKEARIKARPSKGLLLVTTLAWLRLLSLVPGLQP